MSIKLVRRVHLIYKRELMKNIFWDSSLDMLSGFGFAASLILGIPTAVLVILVGVRQIDYHYTSMNCPKRLVAMGKEGKFVSYNFWSYECLAKTSIGTYVPIDNIYNNTQENQ